MYVYLYAIFYTSSIAENTAEQEVGGTQRVELLLAVYYRIALRKRHALLVYRVAQVFSLAAASTSNNNLSNLAELHLQNLHK